MEARDTMLYWLAQACTEARRAASRRHIHIAVRVGPDAVDSSTIARFEKARAWPASADATVAAYAEACGMEPIMLWEDALRRWREGGTPPLVPPPGTPSPGL